MQVLADYSLRSNLALLVPQTHPLNPRRSSVRSYHDLEHHPHYCNQPTSQHPTNHSKPCDDCAKRNGQY
jgi:hypothetical protein